MTALQDAKTNSPQKVIWTWISFAEILTSRVPEGCSPTPPGSYWLPCSQIITYQQNKISWSYAFYMVGSRGLERTLGMLWV